MSDGSGDWADEVHAAMTGAVVRQVAHVPDAGLTTLINRCERDPSIRVVGLTTEEEGVGLLAGAWLGGERGALLMQSSGVGNTVNALASLNRACQLPLFVIVTMRGDWGETNPWQVPMGQAVEPVLRSVGAVVHRVTTPEDAGPATAAGLQLAYEADQLVVVLVSQRVVGAKRFDAPPSGEQAPS